MIDADFIIFKFSPVYFSPMEDLDRENNAWKKCLKLDSFFGFFTTMKSCYNILRSLNNY